MSAEIRYSGAYPHALWPLIVSRNTKNRFHWATYKPSTCCNWYIRGPWMHLRGLYRASIGGFDALWSPNQGHIHPGSTHMTPIRSRKGPIHTPGVLYDPYTVMNRGHIPPGSTHMTPIHTPVVLYDPYTVANRRYIPPGSTPMTPIR